MRTGPGNDQFTAVLLEGYKMGAHVIPRNMLESAAGVCSAICLEARDGPSQPEPYLNPGTC